MKTLTPKTQATVRAKCGEITFTDADVVNLDDWIPSGEFNPRNVRPWLLHDHGFAVAIVFADCEQDALDEACDAGKLDKYQIDESDPHSARDYPTLGNASEPFDIETLGIIEMPNPPRSFAAQWNAFQD